MEDEVNKNGSPEVQSGNIMGYSQPFVFAIGVPFRSGTHA